MPSVTLPTPADKALVRKAVPTSRIYTAAVARLLVAYPLANEWSQTGLWGAAVLCKDRKKGNSYFIRLVALESSQVVWEQELYENFEFNKEAPFFYTFETDDYVAGLEFVDEGEATVFARKLNARDSIQLKGDQPPDQSYHLHNPVRKMADFWHKATSAATEVATVRGGIRKSSIGRPSDFRHEAHVGYTPNHLDDKYNGSGDRVTGQLQNIQEPPMNQMGGQQALAHASSRPGALSSSLLLHTRLSVPPITPAVHSSSSSSSDTAEHPKVPTVPNVPPPPPRSRTISSRQHHPPLPALPPRPEGGAPPPPPTPPAPAVPHPGGDRGRADLMASIRATGGFGNLKEGGHLRNASDQRAVASHAEHDQDVSHHPMPPADHTSLASSLAAAIRQRKIAMRNDDDDDQTDIDDDSEWE
ncbi:WH1 domain-containing protein [Dichotomocladium elegans]|nr:WH1 domain-containing protein [Dichotomocladium elegans]